MPVWESGPLSPVWFPELHDVSRQRGVGRTSRPAECAHRGPRRSRPLSAEDPQPRVDHCVNRRRRGRRRVLRVHVDVPFLGGLGAQASLVCSLVLVQGLGSGRPHRLSLEHTPFGTRVFSPRDGVGVRPSTLDRPGPIPREGNRLPCTLSEPIPVPSLPPDPSRKEGFSICFDVPVSKSGGEKQDGFALSTTDTPAEGGVLIHLPTVRDRGERKNRTFFWSGMSFGDDVSTRLVDLHRDWLCGGRFRCEGDASKGTPEFTPVHGEETPGTEIPL